MSEVGVRLREAVGESLGQLVSELEGGFTTKWIALIESVGADGTRGIWTFAPDDLKSWETMGMLQYALEREKVRMHEIED